MITSHADSRRRFVLAAVAGGIAAGIVSTVVQIALWLLFTNDFPGILLRDARLTAALLFGSRALAPGAVADWQVMGAATLIHFGLSVIYGAVMGAVVRPLAGVRLVAAGALLGVALYIINLYGFTLLLPWFSAARGWITVAAHVAFGVTAVVVFRWLER